MLSSARLSVGTVGCWMLGLLVLAAPPACNRPNPNYHPDGVPAGAAMSTP